ncbi:MAG TPA: HAD hydrolase family protein, partial [Flavitalea sp.]|nr:HAD hydrolase family protein [Flavitalea sp.]
MFAVLQQSKGGFSKPITPLELHYSSAAIRNSNIVFLSASGKNSDILFAYNTAINHDPLNVWGICMKKNTKLSSLAANHSISKILEFNNPAGKDGFLASNSLIAYFTILSRIFGYEQTVDSFGTYEHLQKNIQTFTDRLDANFTITVLYAGWTQPVAIDIESKFTEAGLGNVLLSDFRNFGHGRHNWFDKKKSQSAILALVTPAEKALAEKTLALLPGHIATLVLSTERLFALSTIDLLIQSFLVASAVGEKVGIDPGKPGVPPYGSKLYNLRYQSILIPAKNDFKTINAILRKSRKKTFDELTKEEKSYWQTGLSKFTQKVNSAKYGAIILDFDGTVCTKEERRTLPSQIIINTINKFLGKGFVLGVITGRGKSIRETLEKFIDKKYWTDVIIGYYNGANISLLKDNSQPEVNAKPKKSLEKIYQALKKHPIVGVNTIMTLRPLQLTIESKNEHDWLLSKQMSLDLVIKFRLKDIETLESGHSIDILSKPEVSKTNIIQYCIEECKKRKISENFLCIGDKGQYPGNDYELLQSEFSLSVDEVSSDIDTCWNLSEPGNRGVSTCLQYLESISYFKNHFTIAI